MKCASKQDEIISSSQNFLKGKNVNKAGKIPTLPKRRDCQQSVSRLICGLVHISEMIFPQKNVRFIAINDGVDSAQGDNDFAPLRNSRQSLLIMPLIRRFNRNLANLL